jgi:hypothetical protein
VGYNGVVVYLAFIFELVKSNKVEVSWPSTHRYALLVSMHSSLKQKRPEKQSCSRSSSTFSTLVGIRQGHFEITGRQDVKYTIILALVAPVFASFFRSKLINQ